MLADDPADIPIGGKKLTVDLPRGIIAGILQDRSDLGHERLGRDVLHAFRSYIAHMFLLKGYYVLRLRHENYPKEKIFGEINQLPRGGFPSAAGLNLRFLKSLSRAGFPPISQ